MGIPDHLTCLLKNLNTSQEATVRTEHGTTDWFQIGEGVPQGCILSPCLFNLHAKYIKRNSGLDEAQAGIKIAKEISITSDMQMTPPLWQKVKKNKRASWWRWKKSLLMKVKDVVSFGSGIELESPALVGGFFTTEPPGKPRKML